MGSFNMKVSLRLFGCAEQGSPYVLAYIVQSRVHDPTPSRCISGLGVKSPRLDMLQVRFIFATVLTSIRRRVCH